MRPAAGRFLPGGFPAAGFPLRFAHHHRQGLMPRVLLAPAPLAKLERAFLRVLKDAGFELVYPNIGRQMLEHEVAQFLPTVDASLAGSEPYTAAALAGCPNLKVIARVGVG